MTLLKYAVCVVLLAASAVMADHKKHRKHARKNVTVSQRVVVTEPAPVVVGEPVVVESPVGADPAQVYQPMPGEVQTEVQRTEVYTETRRDECDACRPSKVKRGKCDTCRPCKVRCGKVEIDKLKGKACCTPEGLSSTIRYEVETEHVHPGQLDLVMQFSHRGRLLADEQGRPITVVVQLDQPSDVDDDENEYEGTIQMPLPIGPWGDDLRIQGQVVDRGSNAVLAREHGELELPDDDD